MNSQNGSFHSHQLSVSNGDSTGCFYATVIDGIDYPGNTIATLINVNLASCKSSCCSYSNCVGLVFDSMRTCWLKSQMEPSSLALRQGSAGKYDAIDRNFHLIIYPVVVSLNSCTFNAVTIGISYPGNDIITPFPGPNIYACQTKCCLYKQCKGVEFDINEALCYLKSSFGAVINSTRDSYQRIAAPTSIPSAHPTRRPSRKPTAPSRRPSHIPTNTHSPTSVCTFDIVKVDTDYPGNTLAVKSNIDLITCQRQCCVYSNCKGIVMMMTMTNSTQTQSQSCVLKYQMEPIALALQKSSTMVTTDPCSFGITQTGVSYPGDDIIPPFSGPSIAACQTVCCTYTACRYVEFDLTNALCYLKPLPGPVTDSTATSYIISNGRSTSPSRRPSKIPTHKPSTFPTEPSRSTLLPSNKPTIKTSRTPSNRPSKRPSGQPVPPSRLPTRSPTWSPSSPPTDTPSSKPTRLPSVRPSGKPTGSPTATPSLLPTILPSIVPSRSPSSSPSRQPEIAPSVLPTPIPTLRPTALYCFGPAQVGLVVSGGFIASFTVSSLRQCKALCSGSFDCVGIRIDSPLTTCYTMFTLNGPRSADVSWTLFEVISCL
eukprot:gene5461-10978_t